MPWEVGEYFCFPGLNSNLNCINPGTIALSRDRLCALPSFWGRGTWRFGGFFHWIAELATQSAKLHKRGIFFLLFYVRYSTLIHLPPLIISLCWRMLGSNPGQLWLRHWLSDTRLDGWENQQSYHLKPADLPSLRKLYTLWRAIEFWTPFKKFKINSGLSVPLNFETRIIILWSGPPWLVFRAVGFPFSQRDLAPGVPGRRCGRSARPSPVRHFSRIFLLFGGKNQFLLNLAGKDMFVI